MSLKRAVEDNENDVLKLMRTRHLDAGHVLLSYKKGSVRTYECETCLNRMGRKSFRQMSGRRHQDAEVVS